MFIYFIKKTDYKIVTLNISTYFILKHLDHNVRTMPALTRHRALAMKSNFVTGKFCKVSTWIEVTGLLVRVEIFTTVKNSSNRLGYDIAAM